MFSSDLRQSCSISLEILDPIMRYYAQKPIHYGPEARRQQEFYKIIPIASIEMDSAKSKFVSVLRQWPSSSRELQPISGSSLVILHTWLMFLRSCLQERSTFLGFQLIFEWNSWKYFEQKAPKWWWNLWSLAAEQLWKMNFLFVRSIFESDS